MAVKRTFLGWHASPLVRASDALLARGADLSSLIVVTPGGRVGRLLLGLLVDRAKGPLSPPFFMTPGEVADAVFGERGRVAGPVQRMLAWQRALASCGRLPALLPRQRESAHRGVAGLLSQCHDELIGDGIRFAEVPERGGLISPELERWQDAARVQHAYQEQLQAAGLIDAGLARLEALETGAPVRHPDIVLVGVPELSHVAHRALLAPGVQLETMIAAPADLAHAFDELGLIRTKEWLHRDLPIREEHIEFALGPAEQAAAAFAAIARLDGKYSVQQVAIGTPDAEVGPHLERAARRYGGITARPASGKKLSTTSPARLLDSIRGVLEEGTFDAVSMLVRHPDMERYLLRVLGGTRLERWLAAMDRFAKTSLPTRLQREYTDIETHRTIETVQKLLAPLRGAAPDPNSLLLVLQQVYSGNRVSRDDPASSEVIGACEAIRKAVSQVASLPESWRPTSGAAIIRIVLETCGNNPLPADASNDALELLGWLELPLDPTPVAIVTGMNDGSLPESYDVGALLPDGLRARLGIACSDRRQARDAYLLTLLVNSREHVRLICGKQSAKGDPISPSRLLFAANSTEVVNRVKLWCKHNGDGPRLRAVSARDAAGGENRFETMPRAAESCVASMRVTAFRTFLESPYRFYLEHVLGLQEIERPEPEMDPMSFGDLIHKVLERFGTSDVKDATDPRRIRECTLDHLGEIAADWFGADPAVAVRLQLEIARARLEEFATWQAQRRAEGWLIRYAEWKPKEGAELPGMEVPFRIRGTIDRVDLHEATNQIAILDYKTSETAKSPGSVHGKPGKWKDLQLPLYRHLAAGLDLPVDKAVLGYITVPNMPGGVKLLDATWSENDLADADAKAREIARRVLKGDFFELGPKPPEKGTLAAIAGTAFTAAARKEVDDE